MKVVWKRPDGFHGASPSDYEVVQVAGNAKIWLHRSDNQNYPLRISGGWQDEKATRQLNQLVNLLNKPKASWLTHLLNGYHDSKADASEGYLERTQDWLREVKDNLKGDSWERDIMLEVLDEISQKIELYADEFVAMAAKN